MQFDSLSFVYLVMALALPVSALVGRRLAWRKGVVIALAWAGIFAVVAVLISTVTGP